ncbi:MAG: bifunctional riboflavin kinase/FAD synthetase [Ruminococcaceae bacterium]|nr:bifunctional riboflavin kinase/FAD synthetase [Oscillospiraceae bacterium]
MQIISGKFNKIPQCAIALGKFDAIHKGHQKILDEILKKAKEKNLKTLVFSFEILKHNFIITKDEKEEIFKNLNIDFLYYQAFSDEFKNMSAKSFFDMLVSKFCAKHIVVGDDWHFGKNREGDVNLLKKLCDENNIGVTIIERLKTDDDVISSSKIREYISLGDIKKANNMLGRNFSLSGVVEDGKHLGKKMGFPTANLRYDSTKVLPSGGVYHTKVFYNNAYFDAMTNVGVNPTVEDKNIIRIETHIIDFNKEIYGENIKIEFMDKIRDEVKFSSLNELVLQLEKDKNTIKGKN